MGTKSVPLWRELGDLMTKNCTVIRYNKNLEETDAKLVELLERFQQINLSDRSQWANTTVVFARQLYNMLQLSRVIAQGARCGTSRAARTTNRTSRIATTRIG